MGAKDTETKAYLKNAERVADVFNFIMYGGQQVIQPKNLQELDTTAVALPYGNGAKEPLQKIRDALKLYSAMRDDKAIYLILGIEAQSEAHYAMPVRNMLYDSMSYTEQVSRIAATNRKSEKQMNKAEFLSGFTKDDRLTPVITVVMLFSPDKWDAPRSIHEMLNTQDETVLSFVQDYKIHLISPAEIADMDFDKFQTGLGAVMQFIKHQNEDGMDWIKENKRFEKVDFESASLIKTTTGTDIQIKKGESVNMCRAWQNSINKAKEEARKEGKEEGKKEGKMEGKKEGKMEGKMEGKKEGHNDMLQALQMLKDSISIEKISKSTGCPMEVVMQLKNLALTN